MKKSKIIGCAILVFVLSLIFGVPIFLLGWVGVGIDLLAIAFTALIAVGAKLALD